MSALVNALTTLVDSLHDTDDALESITSNIEKAGTDAKESLNDIGSRIESSNTMISTSIETALDFIDHVKEEIKTSGDASEQVISKIESKLSLLESPGINVKSLDANLKESLKSIASNIETQKQELIDSTSELISELRMVATNVKDGKETLDSVGTTLSALNSIVKYLEENKDNLKMFDQNASNGLKVLSDSVLDASTKNKEGFEAVAALLIGSTDEGQISLVETPKRTCSKCGKFRH